MQKKFFIRFLVSLLAVFWLSLVSLSPASASTYTPRKPMTTCSNCEAQFHWTGNVRGAQVSMTASDPSLNCANGDFYIRELYLPPATQYDTSVEIGIYKCAGTRGFLNCATDNLVVFMYLVEPNNSTLQECDQVLAGDIGGNLNLEIDDYISGTGGINTWEYGANTATYYGCPFNCIQQLNRINVFGNITFDEILKTGSFTNHKIWGSNWTNNQFDCNSGCTGWHYQANSGTFDLVQNPIQMFWHSAPNGATNNGGTMYSCAYPSGTTCTFGS